MPRWLHHAQPGQHKHGRLPRCVQGVIGHGLAGCRSACARRQPAAAGGAHKQRYCPGVCARPPLPQCRSARLASSWTLTSSSAATARATRSHSAAHARTGPTSPSALTAPPSRQQSTARSALRVRAHGCGAALSRAVRRYGTPFQPWRSCSCTPACCCRRALVRAPAALQTPARRRTRSRSRAARRRFLHAGRAPSPSCLTATAPRRRLARSCSGRAPTSPWTLRATLCTPSPRRSSPRPW